MTVEYLGVNTTGTVAYADVTPHATAHTKGSYATLGTTTSACKSITVFLRGGTSSGGGNFLIDIATGATPDIIVNNLYLSIGSNVLDEIPISITLPLAIATSTAVKARAQSSLTSSVAIGVTVGCDSVGAFNYDGVTTMQTYGANTADSAGTKVDAGATVDTKSSYVEIDSSTGSNIKALWGLCGFGDDATRGEDRHLIDLATGAAASEVIWAANVPVNCGGTTDTLSPPVMGPWIEDIASTTRLAMRSQSNTNLAGNRTVDIVFYGADTFAAAGGGGGGMKLVGSGGLAG